jgi:hypothetical protein
MTPRERAASIKLLLEQTHGDYRWWVQFYPAAEAIHGLGIDDDVLVARASRQGETKAVQHPWTWQDIESLSNEEAVERIWAWAQERL